REGRILFLTRHVLMTEISSLSTPMANASMINDSQVQNRTDRPDEVFRILSYVILPVIILGLVGNGAIFWFLCCRIKRTKYTVYVLNLAIADFIVLFCYILSFVFSLIIWGRLAFEPYLYEAMDILTLFGYTTSFFLLTTISIERCLGAFFPLWYNFNRPKHLSAVLCALQWVLSCVVTAVEFFTCWSIIFSSEEESDRMWSAAKIFLTIIFVIFIPIMVLCSLSLFVKIQRHSQPTSPARLYLTIVITVVLFVILALPFRLVCLISYWDPSTEFNGTLLRCVTLLNFINSSVNPFVYFLVGRKKWRASRETLSMVLYRSCKDEVDVVAQEHMSKEQEA
ncbi:proto-oncogene Mas-like, partial [Elgaria multicarinata webbii]|uniref:proto-oncogene Mas-like n=1 Tax=Elgaria multicarinata webbii TaxID=159646 RepID=UPI002FCD270F